MTVVSQQRIDAYAAVSGDRNPLHVDPEFAATTPFGRTIAHGQLVLGLVLRHLEARWPRWPEAGRLEVKFIAPVFAGDDVTITIDDAGMVAAHVADRLCLVGSATLEDAADG